MPRFTTLLSVHGAHEFTTTNMFNLLLTASHRGPSASWWVKTQCKLHWPTTSPSAPQRRCHCCQQGLGHLCRNLTALAKLRIDYRCRYSPDMGKPALSFAANIHRLTALTCLKVGFTALVTAAHVHPL